MQSVLLKLRIDESLGQKRAVCYGAEMEVEKEYCTAWVTFPDLEIARKIATAVVEEQLAACVNLVPSIESIYRWEDKVDRANEVLGICKTTFETSNRLRERLVELHPYELPEVIFLPIEGGNEAYLRWIGDSVPRSD